MRKLHFTRTFLAFFGKMLVMTTPIWGVTLLAVVGLSWLFAVAEGIGFGEALYFSCITALTIGYGDVVPATALGKVMSVVMGVFGVITTGIIVAVALQAIRMTYDDVIEKAKKSLEQNSHASSPKPQG